MAGGATQSVTIDLAVPSSTALGSYSGQLVVGVVGSSESYTLPLQINVVGPPHLRFCPGRSQAPHDNRGQHGSPTLQPIACTDARGAL